MTEEWITTKEAAKFLNVSERQVLNRIHASKLKAKRDGRIWLVHSSLSEPAGEAGEVPERFLNEAAQKLEETVTILGDQLQQKDNQIEEKDRQIENLHNQITMVEDARQRSDTIMLQLTRQLEQSQRLLEYHQEPWYRRWFRKKREMDGI